MFDDDAAPGPPATLTCPHRPPCPGCPRFANPGVAPAARAALEALAREHGLPPVFMIDGALTGFRHRSRLAVRGRVGSPKLGLFELGSHRVVHIPTCRVHHPLINRVAGIVRRAMAQTRLSSYSDKAHLGLVRHLQVVVERSSQTAQVVIVANSDTPEPLAGCFELIRKELGDELHSLWFNGNRDRSNSILGADFRRWCGSPTVIERFGGAGVHYPPGAFGQNNLDIAERIVAHVRAEIPQGAAVAEYYAGVGAIGLSVLDRVGSIAMNELAAPSLEGLQLGIECLDSANRAKISVHAGAAGETWSGASAAEVIVADPPRKGLDAGLIAHLVDQPPQRLLYVSCGLGSLMQDTARLTAGGALRLTALTAFNLFPFTEHVEMVARFDRG